MSQFRGVQSALGPADRVRCQLLTVKEVAAILAISPRSVWRLSATGALKGPLDLGTKTKRWRLSDIEEFLTEVERRGETFDQQRSGGDSDDYVLDITG